MTRLHSSMSCRLVCGLVVTGIYSGDRNKSVFIGEMLSGLQPSLKVGKKNMVSNSASGLLEWVERGSTTIF